MSTHATRLSGAVGAPVLAVVLAGTLVGCGGNSSGKAATDLAKAEAAASSAQAALAAINARLSSLTATPAAAANANPASAAGTPAPTSVTATPAQPSAAVPSVNSPIAAAASAGKAAASGGPKPFSNLSEVDVSRYCAAIPIAQVQALVKAPVGVSTNYPLECDWTGTPVKVSVTPNDHDTKGYAALLGTESHPLAGLGDDGHWFQPVPGTDIPDILARKGSLTCYVEGPDPVSLARIAYTGSDPFFKIKPADALTYVALESKICTDVFSVS